MGGGAASACFAHVYRPEEEERGGRGEVNVISLCIYQARHYQCVCGGGAVEVRVAFVSNCPWPCLVV